MFLYMLQDVFKLYDMSIKKISQYLIMIYCVKQYDNNSNTYNY